MTSEYQRFRLWQLSVAIKRLRGEMDALRAAMTPLPLVWCHCCERQTAYSTGEGIAICADCVKELTPPVSQAQDVPVTSRDRSRVG